MINCLCVMHILLWKLNNIIITINEHLSSNIKLRPTWYSLKCAFFFQIDSDCLTLTGSLSR